MRSQLYFLRSIVQELPESDFTPVISAPKRPHDIIALEDAVHLVSEHVGVAILTKPTALGFRAEGVVVRPLSDVSLCFEPSVIMRIDDTSQLANAFAPVLPPQICLPAPSTKAH
jgi:hypothetical protein